MADHNIGKVIIYDCHHDLQQSLRAHYVIQQIEEDHVGFNLYLSSQVD